MFFSKAELQFLCTLQSGLWDKECNVEVDVDWNKIKELAKTQTVQGIVFDGISLSQHKPDRPIYMKWLWAVKEVEEANSRLNAAVVEIVSRYHDAGLKPILIKGQTVGQNYRIPKHRQPGDIDLYFAEGYDKANELAESWHGSVGQEETLYHKSFTLNGIEIENHKTYVFFYNKQNRMAWDYVCHELLTDNEETFELRNQDGRIFKVRTFNPQMNAIYLYLHLQHHLLQTGVGLRQVCDWACLWKEREKDIDKELFLKIVEALPIKRCMSALTWIVVNHLGLPSGVIPLDTSGEQVRRDGELLLRDILDSGNFGRNSGVMDGFVRNRHWSNLKNYALALKRMIRLRRLCPSEVDAYIKYWISSKIAW